MPTWFIMENVNDHARTPISNFHDPSFIPHHGAEVPFSIHDDKTSDYTVFAVYDPEASRLFEAIRTMHDLDGDTALKAIEATIELCRNRH